MDAAVRRLDRAQNPSFFQKPEVKKCITCALYAIAFAAAAGAVYCGFTRHYAKAAASAAASLVALLLADKHPFPSKKAEEYEEPLHLLSHLNGLNDAPLPGNTPQVQPLGDNIETLLKALADVSETIAINGKEQLKDSTWASLQSFATEKFTFYFDTKFKYLKSKIQSMEMIPGKGVSEEGSQVSATYYFNVVFKDDIDPQYHVSSQIMKCTIAYNTLDANPATMGITSLDFNAPEILPDIETPLPLLPATEAEATAFLKTFKRTNCLVAKDFETYFNNHWGPQCQAFGWTIEQQNEDGDDRLPSIVFLAKNGKIIHTIALTFVLDDDVLKYSFYPKNS